MSGGSTDGAEMAGVLGRNGAKLVNGRKRSWGREDDLATNGDVEKKKRKKEVGPKPARREKMGADGGYLRAGQEAA